MARGFFLTLVVGLLTHTTSLAQWEEVGPLTANPHIQKESSNILKANPNTFDSTFIYAPDTIALPVFDEFSTNKFQVYNADYSDAGVTFDKVYKLLDMSSVPLASDAAFTMQQTFKRTINVAEGTFFDEAFTPTQIRIGSLASYPVTHVPTNVYPPFYIYDTLDYPNDVDTIWIPEPDVFQDSATQFFTSVNDPDLIWLDHHAYHNYSWAVEPWSLGVVSFDGLDENGIPYAINTTTTGYADYLTSKPIDMSVTSAADSVYFSFLWQAEGFGDIPETGDSLVLEFYAKDLDQWNRVWSVNGEGVSSFQQGHILIENTDYFKRGFQFRFKNYGGLSGSLDHFHIDYVNLRQFSGHQDTVIRDFAFVYPVHTLLETFTSIPWDHYKTDPGSKMSSNVHVVVRNSDNVPENEENGSVSLVYGGVEEGSFILDENTLNNADLNYSPWTTYHSFHDFTGGAFYDETKPGLMEEFEFISRATHQNSNFTLNDSTISKQYFQNYYSYDDGSAEAAYGPTGNQARLAIKYTPYEADSLIGAMIHFVQSVDDVSDKLFLLTVWADNGGVPGTVLYEDQLFFPRSPEYRIGKNLFSTYYFLDTMKVHVGGTFYIGWRQFGPERLNVGLDRNIINNDKTFFSVDNGISWNESQIEGSVMIRPIFSTSLDPLLGITMKTSEELSFVLYPNPTSGVVNIRMDAGEFTTAEVRNIQGQLIMQVTDPMINLSDYPSGVYFVRIPESSKTFKLIKH